MTRSITLQNAFVLQALISTMRKSLPMVDPATCASLVSTYLVERCGPSAPAIDEYLGRKNAQANDKPWKAWEGLATRLAAVAQQSAEVDIPMYEKVFVQFDHLQKKADYLEVYLGRDGVYAYWSRMAQLATRAAQGLPIPRVKYLVYPRAFVPKNINDKVAYLTHHGITRSANPIFFDTGFVGTIPNDILGVMGFPQKEWDERIFLLSARTPARKVRFIPDTRRDAIVNQIEYNAKHDQTARGWDENFNPVAEKNSPRERLMASAIRAVLEAYWRKDPEPCHYFVADRDEVCRNCGMLYPDMCRCLKDYHWAATYCGCCHNYKSPIQPCMCDNHTCMNCSGAAIIEKTSSVSLCTVCLLPVEWDVQIPKPSKKQVGKHQYQHKTCVDPEFCPMPGCCNVTKWQMPCDTCMPVTAQCTKCDVWMLKDSPDFVELPLHGWGHKGCVVEKPCAEYYCMVVIQTLQEYGNYCSKHTLAF